MYAVFDVAPWEEEKIPPAAINIHKENTTITSTCSEKDSRVSQQEQQQHLVHLLEEKQQQQQQQQQLA